jgi:ABC-2 type transport system permease protein
MSKLTKIIRMEFRLTAANRLFIILTLLGPFLIAAVALLPSVLAMSGGAMGGPETRIALVGVDARFVEAISPAFAKSGMRFVTAEGSVESLDARVLAGAFDAYLVFPFDIGQATRLELVSRNAVDERATGMLQAVIGQAIVSQRLVKAGISPARVASLTQPPELRTRQLTSRGEKKSTDFLSILMTGLVLAMLLYVTVLLYGQAIGRSVLTEKTSKTVEIMLSSVRAIDLLFGKILGKAAASLLQYGIWVVMSTVFLRLLGPRLGLSIALGISTSTLGFLVLFFILAFFLYCSIYAALGAASQDEQHLTQLAWPVIVFLIIPIVMISPIISAPLAPVIIGLSLFPLTSPIVMLLRIVVGAARPWEILSSIILLLAAIAGMVVLSAKIFRRGVLMTGKRFTLTEVLRLARF